MTLLADIETNIAHNNEVIEAERIRTKGEDTMNAFQGRTADGKLWNFEPTNEPFQLGSISTGTLNWLRNGDSCNKCECGQPPNGHCCSQCCNCPDCESDRWETQVELCPPFVYFGAHPGDRADFGFWPDWGALNDTSPYTLEAREFAIDNVLVKYHYPHVTVMDLDRNVLWTTA